MVSTEELSYCLLENQTAAHVTILLATTVRTGMSEHVSIPVDMA
jgi:hypothetical protein